ncbi:hypothetical protein TUM19329_22390 [Legionella antarctica]|uniref:Uncharacterized protein n=1 Tax=Legionella antarctica TaxID=2708020 RepID=A0A6F8T647_9GAMM|nr:hypothetical protein [Legionella antarctica]BCA95878.1 hypothetical protein TUM19329_22390 [Legionella antarctica]
MRTLILKKILKQHGFEQNNVDIFDDKIRFKIKDINKLELQEEGASIPGRDDTNYHNYIYPEGFISNLEQIEVTFYPENHKYHDRISSVMGHDY